MSQEAAWEGKFTVTPPHCPVLVFIPRPPFLQELSFRPTPLSCATGPPSAPPFLFPFSGNAGPCLHFSGLAFTFRAEPTMLSAAGAALRLIPLAASQQLMSE